MDSEPHLFAPRRAWLLARVAPGQRVLDVGCAAGHFCEALASAGATVIGADIDAGGRCPGGRFELWPAGMPLPLDDNSVDVIWAGEVIEHVVDVAVWLSELRRVLRSQGRLLLSTPYHGRVKSAAIALLAFDRHFDPRGEHVRFFTRHSLTALLCDFGFEQIALRTIGGPPLLRSTMLAEATRAGLRIGPRG